MPALENEHCSIRWKQSRSSCGLSGLLDALAQLCNFDKEDLFKVTEKLMFHWINPCLPLPTQDGNIMRYSLMNAHVWGRILSRQRTGLAAVNLIRCASCSMWEDVIRSPKMLLERCNMSEEKTSAFAGKLRFEISLKVTEVHCETLAVLVE